MQNVRFLNEVSVKRILILGGNAKECRSVIMFTPEKCDWKLCRPMRTSHGMFCIETVTLNGEVFTVSGDDSKSAGTMERYNYLTDEWISCPSMPTRPMFASAVAVEGDKILVSGGLCQTSGFFSSDIHEFSLATNAWREVGNLPEARYGHTSIFFDGAIWIVGGQHEGKVLHSRCVSLLDPETFEMRPGADMTVPRIWCKLFIIRNRLYAVGGDSLNGRCVPTIEVYDRTAKTWEVGVYSFLSCTYS